MSSFQIKTYSICKKTQKCFPFTRKKAVKRNGLLGDLDVTLAQKDTKADITNRFKERKKNHFYKLKGNMIKWLIK